MKTMSLGQLTERQLSALVGAVRMWHMQLDEMLGDAEDDGDPIAKEWAAEVRILEGLDGRISDALRQFAGRVRV